MSVPARAPRACGALGPYDEERLRRIAELLGEGLEPAHEDGSSALWLDREPLRWSGRRELGLGWIEADARRAPPQLPDWRAAAAAGVCGLVLDGRRATCASGWSRSASCTPGGAATGSGCGRSTRPTYEADQRRSRRRASLSVRSGAVRRQLRVPS